MQREPGERLEPGEPIVVQYFKYSGDLHWRHDVEYLGEDRHGRWLGGPTGATVQRGNEAPIAWPSPFVQLIAPDQWWTLIYNGSHGGDFRIYVDIVTPARWVNGTRVEMVDLDLDVVQHLDGSVEVLDEDEFVEHSKLFAYPDSVIDRARTTAAELVLGIESGREPFGSDGEHWLETIE